MQKWYVLVAISSLSNYSSNMDSDVPTITWADGSVQMIYISNIYNIVIYLDWLLWETLPLPNVPGFELYREFDRVSRNWSELLYQWESGNLYT